MEIFIVVSRIFAASFANVFQKRLTHKNLHPFFIVLLSYLVLSIICIPLLCSFDLSQLNNSFWINIFLAALVDMLGTLFLVMSLSKTDLSIFGPLNAYKVVISTLLAMIFLHEIPSLQGLIGVIIILIGSFFLSPCENKTSFKQVFDLFSRRGVQYRFLSILLFSIGTLPLKNAVSMADPLPTTVFWCLFGFPLSIITYALFIKGSFKLNAKQARNHVYDFLYLGLLMFLMQYASMFVLSQFLISYTLALFQLSMVLQVFLGYRIFNEDHFMRRLSACVVMVAGSILVLSA